MSRRIAIAEQKTRLLAFGVDAPERDAVLLEFGQKLRSLRLAAGLSQDQLAAASFLRPTDISSLELGKRAPSLLVLLTLAEAVKSTVAELMADLPPIRRRAGRERVLSRIPSTARGVSGYVLRCAPLGLPHWYVMQIIRCLEANGEVVKNVSSEHRLSWRRADGLEGPGRLP